MAAATTVGLVEQGRMARRSGQGSDVATGWTGPQTFIRAMQTMKRKLRGMSDQFEDGCLCGAVRFAAAANLSISGSVTKAG